MLPKLKCFHWEYHLQVSVWLLPSWSGESKVKIHLHMMTSSNGNIFVTGLLCGEFTSHRWITRTKASGAELWYFFDLRLNKRLSKQWRGWWCETPLRPSWRHCNVYCRLYLLMSASLMTVQVIHFRSFASISINQIKKDCYWIPFYRVSFIINKSSLLYACGFAFNTQQTVLWSLAHRSAKEQHIVIFWNRMLPSSL